MLADRGREVLATEWREVLVDRGQEVLAERGREVLADPDKGPAVGVGALGEDDQLPPAFLPSPPGRTAVTVTEKLCQLVGDLMGLLYLLVTFLSWQLSPSYCLLPPCPPKPSAQCWLILALS